MTEELVKASGAVGLQSGLGIGNTGYPFAQGKEGDLLTNSLGKYYAAAKFGRLFMASTAGAQAISVALATTYTGLCLSNDNSSEKDLVLLRVGIGLSVAQVAEATLHLIGNYSTTNVTHTTPVSAIKEGRIGANFTPVGKVDSAATIPTPVYLATLMGAFTAGAFGSTSPTWIDVDGAIILKPGAFCAIGALTAVTGIWSMVWAEVPS